MMRPLTNKERDEYEAWRAMSRQLQILGSIFPFGLSKCQGCRALSPVTADVHHWSHDLQNDTCAACQRVRLSHRLEHDLLPLQVRNLNLGSLIVHYFIPTDIQTFKRKLHNYIFRGRQSPLSQFTYFHNSLAGNIDKKTDILDRIIEYIC
jgi:hypothetical protein